MAEWSQKIQGKEVIVAVICIRGCTYKKLLSKIKRNQVPLGTAKDMLIHIGTNDLDNNSMKWWMKFTRPFPALTRYIAPPFPDQKTIRPAIEN